MKSTCAVFAIVLAAMVGAAAGSDGAARLQALVDAAAAPGGTGVADIPPGWKTRDFGVAPDACEKPKAAFRVDGVDDRAMGVALDGKTLYCIAGRRFARNGSADRRRARSAEDAPPLALRFR